MAKRSEEILERILEVTGRMEKTKDENELKKLADEDAALITECTIAGYEEDGCRRRRDVEERLVPFLEKLSGRLSELGAKKEIPPIMEVPPEAARLLEFNGQLKLGKHSAEEEIALVLAREDEEGFLTTAMHETLEHCFMPLKGKMGLYETGPRDDAHRDNERAAVKEGIIEYLSKKALGELHRDDERKSLATTLGLIVYESIAKSRGEAAVKEAFFNSKDVWGLLRFTGEPGMQGRVEEMLASVGQKRRMEMAAEKIGAGIGNAQGMKERILK